MKYQEIFEEVNTSEGVDKQHIKVDPIYRDQIATDVNLLKSELESHNIAQSDFVQSLHNGFAIDDMGGGIIGTLTIHLARCMKNCNIDRMKKLMSSSHPMPDSNTGASAEDIKNHFKGMTDTGKKILLDIASMVSANIGINNSRIKPFQYNSKKYNESRSFYKKSFLGFSRIQLDSDKVMDIFRTRINNIQLIQNKLQSLKSMTESPLHIILPVDDQRIEFDIDNLGKVINYNSEQYTIESHHHWKYILIRNNQNGNIYKITHQDNNGTMKWSCKRLGKDLAFKNTDGTVKPKESSVIPSPLKTKPQTGQKTEAQGSGNVNTTNEGATTIQNPKQVTEAQRQNGKNFLYSIDQIKDFSALSGLFLGLFKNKKNNMKTNPNDDKYITNQFMEQCIQSDIGKDISNNNTGLLSVYNRYVSGGYNSVADDKRKQEITKRLLISQGNSELSRVSEAIQQEYGLSAITPSRPSEVNNATSTASELIKPQNSDRLAEYNTPDKLINHQKEFLKLYLNSIAFKDAMTVEAKLFRKLNASTEIVISEQDFNITQEDRADKNISSLVESRRNSRLHFLNNVKIKTIEHDTDGLGGFTIITDMHPAINPYTPATTSNSDATQGSKDAKGLKNGDIVLYSHNNILSLSTAPVHEMYHSITRFVPPRDKTKTTATTTGTSLGTTIDITESMVQGTIEKNPNFAYYANFTEIQSQCIEIKYLLWSSGLRNMDRQITIQDIINLSERINNLNDSPTRKAGMAVLSKMKAILGISGKLSEALSNGTLDLESQLKYNYFLNGIAIANPVNVNGTRDA